MPINGINIDYVELAEGLEEGSDERGGYVNKTYLVNWGDRFLFIQAMRGSSRQVGGLSGNWRFTIPYSYPESPGLYATAARIEPLGRFYQTTPISYDFAKIWVTFRALDWQAQVSDDPLFLNQIDPEQPILFCTQELDYSAEYTQLPTKEQCQASGITPPKFLATAQPIESPAYARMTIIRMVLTWQRLPYLPMGQIVDYADSINDAPFLEMPKGCVMFGGPKTVHEQMDDGTVVQKLTFEFKARPVDWNMFMRPDGQWDVIYFNGSSANKTYPYMDFSLLVFQAPTA